MNIYREKAGYLDNLSPEEITNKINKKFNKQSWLIVNSQITLLVTIIISVFLMNVLSANFGTDLSKAWMKSCLYTFMYDTFLGQTLKSLFIYFYPVIDCFIYIIYNKQIYKSNLYLI